MEWLVSRKGDAIATAMLLSVRDGVLKVLYFYGSPAMAGQALRVLTDYAAGRREVYALLFSHPGLREHSDLLRKVALRKKIRQRRVGISRKLVPDSGTFKNSVFQLGDGDAVFT
jgi:hypothetical protein